MRVSVIMPALNEEAAVGLVGTDVARIAVDEVIVVDNGSADRTVQVASAAGATVVSQPLRGYGAACLAGARTATGDVLVFLDADGSFEACQIPSLVEPISLGRAELVLGSRELGGVGHGVTLPHQRVGNWLAVQLLRLLYGLEVTDLGPFRAILASSLARLGMEEMTYGWPVEMMVKAARAHYRIAEVPVSYLPRLGGQSKVSGTIRGSLLAGYHILRTVMRYAWRRDDVTVVADEGGGPGRAN